MTRLKWSTSEESSRQSVEEGGRRNKMVVLAVEATLYSSNKHMM